MSTSTKSPLSAPLSLPNLDKERVGTSSGRYPAVSVKPSSLLKSPVLANPRQLSSGLYRDKKLRLASEQCQIQRRRGLRELSRNRLVAEEEQGKMEEAEIDLLIRTEDKGLTYTGLDPQNALQLARAARGVVFAEFRTASLRVKECEMLLETLKDAEEQARATWCDANDQMGSLLTFFHRQSIRIDLLPTPHYTSHTHSWPSFASLHSETHSVETDSADSNFKESFSEDSSLP